MRDDLLRWLTEPPRTGTGTSTGTGTAAGSGTGSTDRGIHLADDRGRWVFHSYREIAASARRVAGSLAVSGVGPGDVVCVLLPTGFPCLSSIFGIWAAGATLCLVPPPSFAPEAEYVEHAAGIVGQTGAAVTVTSAELAPVAARVLAAAGADREPWVWRDDGEEAPVCAPGGPALLQFTSGSSSRPRGVRVGWANLTANIAMIQDRLGWRAGDSTASWLPLHHDMGLIGCLLTTVSLQEDLWLMRPEQFIRDPARWLDLFSHTAHTAAPPFAFEYAVRRLGARLGERDLSAWRTAITGAEPVSPGMLERFTALAAPAGFSPDVFLPSYGLAEATLAVTVRSRRTPLKVVRVDTGGLRFGRPVTVDAERGFADGTSTGTAAGTETNAAAHDTADAGTGWMIGCGPPADGLDVSVLDEDGKPLPDGHLGEIAVAGPSVTDGYHAGRTGSTRIVDGALRTGDAGFLHRGELFVLGRMGDSLKAHGRSVYMEDLEARVAAATGIARDKCAVVGVGDADGAAVTLFVERPGGDWVREAGAALRGALGDGIDVTVVVGRSGLISRTSSGKPRRRHMWEQLRAGGLRDAHVLENDGATTGRPCDP